MTPSFLKALSRTSLHEGGYSNHPNDPGGETMYGVTSRTARAWGYKGEMRFLPLLTAQEILYKEFWLPIRGDEIPFPLAYQLFDISVHSGPSRATHLLQKVLGVQQDGIYGPATLRSTMECRSLELCKALLLARHEFQRKLPNWSSSPGWSRRNIENAFYLLDDFSPDRVHRPDSLSPAESPMANSQPDLGSSTH